MSRDGRDLLAAYRAERGPARREEDRLWARLEGEVAVASDGEVAAGHGPPARSIASIAAAALVLAAAAAVVLAWPLRRALDPRTNEDPKSLSAHDRDADPALRSARPGHDAGSPRAPEPYEAITPEGSSPAPAAPFDGHDTASPSPAISAPLHDDPRTRPKPRAPRPSAGSGAPEPTPTPVVKDSLADETRSLRQARAALSAGRAADALAQLDAYDRAFPRALLAEEADAVRTMARCRTSPRDPEALAEAFAARHRSSLFRKQVDAACVPKASESGSK